MRLNVATSRSCHSCEVCAKPGPNVYYTLLEAGEYGVLCEEHLAQYIKEKTALVARNLARMAQNAGVNKTSSV